MVLRPVELNTSRNPRTNQTNECWLDDVIIIHKVALSDLVVCHLHTSAKFWQHHHLDILILNPDGMIVNIFLLVAHRLDDGIGIYNTTRSLIHSLLQEDGVLLRLSYLIRRNSYDFSPSFYHHNNLTVLLFQFLNSSILQFFNSSPVISQVRPGSCLLSLGSCAAGT